MMSLLKDVQSAIIEGSQDLGSFLLKVKFIASKLESDPLEAWVRNETEGYEKGIEIPDYRKIPVGYTGTFTGHFGSGVKNAPIPSYLVAKHASPEWNFHEMRLSVSAIEDAIARAQNDVLYFDASNLILLLQGNVYEDFACNQILGRYSVSSLKEVINITKNRILDLTLQIEKDVPEARSISMGFKLKSQEATDKVGKITQNIIYGNVQSFQSDVRAHNIEINVRESDNESLQKQLKRIGVDEADAEEFVKLVSEEMPTSHDDPFGPKAKSWIAEKIQGAIHGTWKVGVDVASAVLTEAVKRYYGLS